MKHRFAAAALAAFSIAGAQAAGPAPSAPLGRWITESGNLEVELAPCGDALCGTVVRVLANRAMAGPPGQEMAPADARPALGMVILSQLRPSGEGEYSGTIYNRENAKSYGARLTLAAPGELLVRAYVGLPLFGKTQVWRRAAAVGAGAGAAP
ncbi:MAG: DUF2147 domain-containing protein [Pseudomonadota bacterium]